MNKIASLLDGLLQKQDDLKKLNKEVKQLRSFISDTKDQTAAYMGEENLNILDFRNVEVRLKKKDKKPTLAKNMEAWMREYFEKSGIDVSHATNLVAFFKTKGKEVIDTTDYISVVKKKVPKRKKSGDGIPAKKQKAEPEPEPEHEETSPVEKNDAEIDDLF